MRAGEARRERLATLQVEKLGVAGVDLTQVYAKRADGLAAGNCIAGTNSFIRRRDDVLKGKTSICADELLALAKDNATHAAVLRAITRMLAEGRLP